MVKRISEQEFITEFKSWDTYANNFTIDGLRALYMYFENTETETTPFELDVVAICCEYTEYTSAWEAMQQYQPEDMPTEGEDGDDLLEIQEKNENAAYTWLEERTIIIDIRGVSDTHKGIIIQDF